ncbi:MAG: maltose alpha-D-glucosyltransferase [Leptolinea sp.]|jgi:maltose alpha-D-glucosyltransferase/alpha-amylase|nr:maltose alpha-D-glucosyltransferase [Leptolinea sp.]
MKKDWFMNAIFYELYVRAFRDSNGDGKGDIPGVIEKLDYLKDLGVDCIWLLPMYPSPLKDDGYDISDFMHIHPDFGTIDDYKRLMEEAHKREMYVVADLVLNHSSDQHAWFQAALKDPSSPFKDYYVWSKTGKEYADARIIFLDTEPSNWAYCPEVGEYYWHRFYSSQPDLNYDNPAVQEEMLNTMRYWASLGLDGFRADAVPYLFEREGTNCENLPVTHNYLKKIRRTLDMEYPGRILLAEANQWPVDVREYFGNGDEFTMAFHFPLMPRIYMAMKKGDPAPIRWAIENTPAIPDGCQWCTFLRNHDELTLEMVTPEEREWMWQQYAPDPKMRLNLGIRRRLAPLLDNDPEKIRQANAILYSLPGTPIIYYGDEIGMGDNIDLFDRNGVRTPMQWSASQQNAGFSEAGQLYAPVIAAAPYAPEQINVADQQKDPQSLLNFMKHLVRLRKERPFLAKSSVQFLDTTSPATLCVIRGDETHRLIALHNLGDNSTDITLPSALQFIPKVELLTGTAIPQGLKTIKLAAHQSAWLE